MYNSLQIREIFHLEFLRWFSRVVKPSFYALKGGVNMRFFFNSFRYSEDMDLDIKEVSLYVLQEYVMKILESTSFKETLKIFGVEEIIAPDLAKAKQTQTTQRFKIHLITGSGEDLFTKIEFSRRGFKGNSIVETVLNSILRQYKVSPILVSHYDIYSIITQKIYAITTRAVLQARDIFDLYILSSQYRKDESNVLEIDIARLKKSYENVFEVSFNQFRDTVISYLSSDDQKIYNSQSSWDEIQLKTANFINELRLM